MSEADIRTTLENLPKDLAETYERIMLRIQKSKAGDYKLVMSQRIFMWIISAQRPLLMAELKEAVAFTPEAKSWDSGKIPQNQKQILQACGHLVVYDKGDETVRLAHYTVQQFLISRSLKPGGDILQFSLNDADRWVGEVCVAYLSFSDFETQLST